MKKSEIVAAVLSTVSEETGIDIGSILSQNKRREIVDARHIAIVMLSRQRMYQSSIAEMFRVTPRNVQYIMSDFDDRLSYSPPMRGDYERIAKRIGNNCETGRK